MTEVSTEAFNAETSTMNSTAASNFSSKLSNLLQHLDAVQAAAQISRLATDVACAFGSVRFVLGELSTVKNNVPACTMPLYVS